MARIIRQSVNIQSEGFPSLRRKPGRCGADDSIAIHCNAYRFQSPPGQDPLCRRRDTASIALQIPHDLASAQLREHLRDLLHLGRVNGIPTSAGPATSRGTVVAVKEPSEHKEGYHGQCEEGGYIQRRLVVMHYAFGAGFGRGWVG